VVLAIPVYAAIWLGHIALLRLDPRLMRRGIFVFVAAAGLHYLCLH
jgi:hypothetical protein